MTPTLAHRSSAAEPRVRESERVRMAVAKLKSLRDGDAGVIETIASGSGAVPALTEILFAREPSGLYETRRRAVEALSGLRAYDVLRRFLSEPHEIGDPVERMGEEAVVNAAARALGDLRDAQDLPLLLALLRRKALTGVIEAVGRFRRPEALPFFIDALADDFTRPAAEEAIRTIGTKARPALLQTALWREPRFGGEVNSSRARRRSALALLLEFGVPRKFVWPPLHDLIEDADPWVSVLSARMCLAGALEEDKQRAICRLIELLKTPDTILTAEIEDCLVRHFAQARLAIGAAIACGLAEIDPDEPWWLRDKALTALLRVRERAEGKPSGNGADE